MAKNKYKPMLLIFFFLAIMLAYLVVAGSFLYQKYLVENAPPGKKISLLDTSAIYDLYISNAPNIDYTPFYGNPGAKVTLIAYMDIYSPATKFYLDEIFPKIREEFINTGKLKYYQKSYITEEDSVKKTNRFIYTKLLYCVSKISKEAYYGVYFGLAKDKEKITSYAEKYNISNKLLTDCIASQEFDEIKEDISEIKRLGISGIKQKFYLGIEGRNNKVFDGIPGYESFRRSIRQSILQIGEPA